MKFPWLLLALMLAGVAAGGSLVIPLADSLPQTTGYGLVVYAAGWACGLAGAFGGGWLALRLQHHHGKEG